METTRFGTVLALWAAGLGAAAQFGKVAVTFEILAEVYGTAGAALGFVVSLVGLVGIVFGITAGLIVARVGYRRAVIGALLLGALASLYQSTLPPLGLLLVSRALEGVSHLAIVVAAPTLIAFLSAPRHQGLTLSLWSTFFGVAFAILVWLGLPLARVYGAGALFAAHGAYMIAIAVLIGIVLPRDQIGPQDEDLSLRRVLQDHIRIYRSPWLSAPALGWVCYAAAFVAILTIMPPFLDPSQRDLVIGAVPLAGILSSMTIGVWLLRHWPATRIVQLGFGLALIVSVVVWTLPGQAWPYLVLAMSLGLIQGASFAAIPQLNTDPKAQAQANGALAQMGNVGTTSGTPVLAALVGLGGINGFLIFALILFSAGFLAHQISTHRRKYTDM